MTSPRIGRRHGSPPREKQPRASYLRADMGSYIAEDIVEDSILRKQTMCCAKVVLVPEEVEWC
jgi:hypothetical protein